MSKNKSEGVVDEWTKHVAGDGETYLIGAVTLDGQVGDDTKPLKIVGPITYMDRDSGIAQTRRRLLRLGNPRGYTKSVCRRLMSQLQTLDA